MEAVALVSREGPKAWHGALDGRVRQTAQVAEDAQEKVWLTLCIKL